MVNGQQSSVANVRCGIPQGSILGPTLFVLYTIDLPSSVPSGSVFMYADDTTVYCVGDNVDNAVTSLNVALSDLKAYCTLRNGTLRNETKRNEICTLRNEICKSVLCETIVQCKRLLYKMQERDMRDGTD